MPAAPQITAIIPTYRRPRFLRRAIRSVLAQSYEHVRVCVFDNASQDTTAAVVAEMAKEDPRIQYHCHKENVGALGNYAFAIQQVDTPYFSFLGDDDVLFPDFYETAMKSLEEHPSAMFSACTTITMNEKGKVMGATSYPDGYWTPPEGMLRMIRQHINWTGVLFRREVTELVGSLDPNVGAPADLDFLLRIAARFPFTMIQHPAAIWMNHAEASSAKNNSKVFWPGWLNMIANLSTDSRIPEDAREDAKAALTRQLKTSLFLVGGKAVKDGNYDDAAFVANILRSVYRERLQAGILTSAAALSRHVPGVRAIVALTSTTRGLLRRKHTNPLQERYGEYSKYLRIEE